MSSFGDLDLTEYETQGEGGLEPGRYVATIAEAKMVPTKSGTGRMVEVKLVVPGQGAITDRINTYNPNEIAQRIGRERLKTLLTYSGHPNPNRPGDVASMRNRKVGIVVVKGEDWTNDRGERRPGRAELKKSGAYFKPEGDSGEAEAKSPSTLDDEIPF